MMGRARIRSFQNLVDRTWNKISNWKTKFLSVASKEILLKSIIQAIPTCTISIFLLPKTILGKLNSLFKKFWWGMNGDSFRFHWLDWNKIGVAMEKEDLDLRDLYSFNIALLANKCKRLLQNPKSLVAMAFKQKYFRNEVFMVAKTRHNSSFVWKSLLVGKELFSQSIIWCIGYG